MKIRYYSPFDNARVHQLIRFFQETIQLNPAVCVYDPNRLDEILTQVRAGNGICLVAEDKDKIVQGMVLGLILPNIWNPRILVMHELAFWLEPNHRGGRVAWDLLTAYTHDGQDLVRRGKIQYFTMMNLQGSDLDYSDFGYKKWQEEWIQ